MATGSDTPEHEVFLKNLNNISKGILPELVEFASKAVEKKLLAPDKLDEILKSPKTFETALKMTLILLQRIEQNNSEFYEILEILKSMPTLAPVVNMLQLQTDDVSSHINKYKQRSFQISSHNNADHPTKASTAHRALLNRSLHYYTNIHCNTNTQHGKFETNFISYFRTHKLLLLSTGVCSTDLSAILTSTNTECCLTTRVIIQ